MAAVQQHDVRDHAGGQDREPGAGPGEPERGDDAQRVDLVRGGVPDGRGHAPAADQGHQAFAVRHFEQLAVPHIGQQRLLVEVHDGDSHADGPGEGAAAHLVDAGKEPGAGAAEAPFVVERGGFGHGVSRYFPAGSGTSRKTSG